MVGHWKTDPKWSDWNPHKCKTKKISKDAYFAHLTIEVAKIFIKPSKDTPFFLRHPHFEQA